MGETCSLCARSGIRGFGIATAARVIRQYGSLETMLDNIEAVAPRARSVRFRAIVHFASLLKWV